MQLQQPTFDKMTLARLKLCRSRPYLGSALWAITIVPVKNLMEIAGGAMACDAYWRVYVDPDRIQEYTPDQVATMLWHEMSHLLRDHAKRGKVQFPFQPQVWNFAGDCFPAGTWMAEGKPIEEMAMMRRPHEGHLVRLRTQAGSLAATPEHPVWVRQRRHKIGLHPIVLNDPEWVPIGEVRVGDFICVPRLSGKIADTTIDFSGYVASGTDSLGRRTFANRATTRVPLDESTAWLLGLYVAEGSSSPLVRFSLGSHERDLADHVAKVVGDLGWSTCLQENGSSLSVTTGATVFGRWLKEHCGNGAHQKRIPRCILYHADPLIRRAFLDGLIEGDGYVGIVKNGGKEWSRVGTVSDKLERDLLLLLAQDGIGVHSHILEYGPRRIGDTWTDKPLRLHDIAFNRAGPSVSTRVMNGHSMRSTNTRWKADEEGVWYPIKERIEEPFNGLVYNLETPDHTYVADSFKVHNCEINDDLPMEQKLLIELNGVKSPLDFKFPYEVITPESFHFDRDQLAETYYRLMMQQAQEAGGASGSGGSAKGEQQKGQSRGKPGDEEGDGQGDQGEGRKPARGCGEGNCGSGAGGERGEYELPDPGTPDAHGEETPGVRPARADLIQRDVAEQVLDLHEKSRGTVPAGLLRWAKEKKTAKVDWRKHISAAVKGAVAEIAGQIDYAYTAPAREQSISEDVIFPNMVAPVPRFCCQVDTSGSVSESQLSMAMAEIKRLMQQYPDPEGTPVLATDAATAVSKRCFRPEQVKLYGGGGTDMGDGLAVMGTLRPKRNIGIVFTDGLTPWPDNAPRGMKIIVVMLQAQGAGNWAPPHWAQRVIYVPQDDTPPFLGN